MRPKPEIDMQTVSHGEILATLAKQMGVDRADPFYTDFECVRLGAILRELPEGRQLNILDFGYLRGMLPKVILSFRRAHYTVFDHPGADFFRNTAEQALAERLNVVVESCDLTDRAALRAKLVSKPKFDAIILGEVVEHLDPTVAADVIATLAQSLGSRGKLIVTTPNLFGIANVARHLIGKDVQELPFGHEVMIQGHIHLWSPSMLRKVFAACGLVPRPTFYYHGLEGTQYRQSNKEWRSLGYQAWHKSLHILAVSRACWRGFFVLAGEKEAD
jgi:hypothetical protein